MSPSTFLNCPAGVAGRQRSFADRIPLADGLNRRLGEVRERRLRFRQFQSGLGSDDIVSDVLGI
jgi:hypothetical protein